MRILVTGGCGFIGSNFIRLLMKEGGYKVTNLDLLTYAGNLENVEEFLLSPEYEFVQGDVRDPYTVDNLIKSAEMVVHFAAETHVDRSLSAADNFITTNILGTQNILEAAKRVNPQVRILHVSTDEVYGDVPAPVYPTETSLLNPSSPYSASKASSDLLALASYRSFGTDVIISRCTNNYGPYQYPEKLIPLFICNALLDKPLPLYDGGTQIRDWLYVEDHCQALLTLLIRGRSGEIYNIGANQNPEVSNAEIANLIISAVNKDAIIDDVYGSRPGHDQRYAVDTSKIRGLGWSPQKTISSGVDATVEWYKNNAEWWEPLLAPVRKILSPNVLL